LGVTYNKNRLLWYFIPMIITVVYALCPFGAYIKIA